MRSGCSLSEAGFEPKEMHFISQAGGSNWALEEKLLSEIDYFKSIRKDRITPGTALSFLYWQWTMRCSLMNQDGTMKTYLSFNIQCSNKTRLIKAEVANHGIKIGLGSNFWKDFFKKFFIQRNVW